MARPRLYEPFSGRDGFIALVSAPPGFGKSTFVTEWLRSEDRRFVWYSLDEFDREPGLFGTYLAAAVGRLSDSPGGPLNVLGAPEPDVPTIVTSVLEDLQEAPPGSVIVLDDYQELEGSEAHEAAAYLIDRLPTHIGLVLITRADPALPMGRYRALGRAIEVRGADLRFTEAEIGEYFEHTRGVVLTGTEGHEVAERSEGWVAALQLVSLQEEANTGSGVLAALSGDHPHIAGYLVDEVLERLDPSLADFLLSTAFLERFDSALCRAVTASDRAPELLAELERRNAFLIPLSENSRGWYRYHQLFAELLRARARRTDPRHADAVLEKAANECEKLGMLDDAIDYALRSGDVALAADIADRNIGGLLGKGEIARVRSWLSRFPVPAGPSEPIVTMGWAWCRVFEGGLTAATELIDRVEADYMDSFATDVGGQLELMRSMVAFQGGDHEASESHARHALELLPKPSQYLESLAHLMIGRALYASSRRAEARPHLERSASLASRGNLLAGVNALFWLGVIEFDEGNLAAAEAAMTRGQEASSSSPDDREPAAGIADIGLAYVRLNQLDLEEAIQLAERGTQLLKRSMYVEMVFRGYFAWAESLSLAGHYEEAETIAGQGITWLTGRSMGGGALEAWLRMSLARNAWRQGKLDESARRLDQVREQGLGGSTETDTVGFFEAAAMLSLAVRRGDLEESRRLLTALPETQEEYVMFEIGRHVLSSAVHEIAGEKKEAVHAMELALSLGQEGYGYQISHVGPVVRPVLERMVGRTPHDGLVRLLLERLPLESARPVEKLIDPLTDRELDVLAEIAAGYTNEQIAERLFISRGTVKRHTANIYMKLGAHHRTEAAAIGREMGLIT